MLQPSHLTFLVYVLILDYHQAMRKGLRGTGFPNCDRMIGG